MIKIAFSSNSGLKQVTLVSCFRTTVPNGYKTVPFDKIYGNLRILTYIKKWDVPCLVEFTYDRNGPNQKSSLAIY